MIQFVIFKLEETIGFNVKASFTVSCLIKSGDITKLF